MNTVREMLKDQELVDFLNKRIDLGVAFLDIQQPDWWTPENTNLDKLQMNSPCLCMLGQNFAHLLVEGERSSGYWKALSLYHLSKQDSDDMGFSTKDLETEMEYYEDEECYTLLTHLWKERVKQIRQAKLTTAQ